MSKLENIDALLESAIEAFAKDGYEGASLRDIARRADVPLSTIHLYFGTKSDLFDAVRRKAWSELDRERGVLLEAAWREGGNAAPPLRLLVHALAYPVVRRALSKNARDVWEIALLRDHWKQQLDSSMLETADRSMIRWVEAIRLGHPALTQPDAAWALSFVLGTIYSWQLIDHRYDSMIGADATSSTQDAIGDIIAFCCGGVQAMVDRRTRQ